MGRLSDMDTPALLRFLRTTNILDGIALVTVAAFSTFGSVVDLSVAKAILAFYVTFFAGILICAELRLRNLEHKLSNNFGFIFTFLGRMCYLFFLATIAAAMGNMLAYIVAIATAVIALINCWVLYTHPSFKSGELSIGDNPFHGTAGEDEIKAYLRAHPEIGRKLATGGVRVAKNNPDLALKVARNAL
eukprot:TRINITY_DN8049_c0_g1_i1.p1 TRINITY_DN8049_c0_g1~~TRINITY_DN8049_c0_g1_i1.p1  ORF type:complete len:189 (+),score=52.59 TRINITY_DN8049_c0_g1_i1:94-660(+)